MYSETEQAIAVITMHYVASSNILKLVGSRSGFECLPLSDYSFRYLIHLIPSLHQVLVRWTKGHSSTKSCQA